MDNIIEQIAKEWDGCLYNGVGQMIDIGKAIRDQAAQLVQAEIEQVIKEAIEQTIKAESISLTQTCGACPEAYDAYIDDQYVGHFRLRYGHFTVRDSHDNMIYTMAIPGCDGIFDSDSREHYLNEGKKTLAAHLSKQDA